MSDKHAPTPWVYASVGTAGTFSNLVDICEVRTMDGHAIVAEHVLEADAAFIVKAANAHNTLVEALRDIAQSHDGDGYARHRAMTALRATGATL